VFLINLIKVGNVMKQSFYEKMKELANEELENYDFYQYIIEEKDGWAYDQHAEEIDRKNFELRRVLFASHEDLEEDADSIRISFSVRFKNGKVCDVSALEMDSGSEVGKRG
jgi:hypothetical protein